MDKHQILFYIGLFFLLVGFGTSLIAPYMKERVKKILTWVCTGSTLCAAICYIIAECME